MKRVIYLWTLGMVLSGMSIAEAGTVLRFKQGEVQTDSLKSASVLSERNSDLQTHFFIVQFKSKITRQDQQALKQLGLKIYNYIPDDALLVKAPSYNLEAALALPGVQAVVPFAKEWRLSPEFAPLSVFNRATQQKVTLRVTSLAEAAAVKQQLTRIAGVQVLAMDGKSLVLEVTGQALDLISKTEGVLWVQPYVNMQTMAIPLDDFTVMGPPSGTGDFTDLTGKESGTEVMNLPAAWKRGFDGRGQVAAMADTGLDSGDTKTLWKDFGGVKEGQVYGMFSSSWEDPMGHGTHVAGSIMSSGAGNNGMIKGSAPAAQLVAQSMWSPMLENLTVPPDMAAMFQKAYDSGARVHSNSWGSPRNPGSYDANAQQVDEFMWKHPDFLILFAAGNSGEDKEKTGRISEGSVGTPGTAKNILTVGASENLVAKGGIQKKLSELRSGADKWGVEPLASSRLSDNIDAMAVFSSRGPTADGRLKPEIVAPGTNVLSNCSHIKGAEMLWGAYNKDYCFSGGTSMSTPLTAGAATVLRQFLVEKKKLTSPSAALIKNLLMHTAHDMYPGHFGEIGKARGQELLVHRPDVNQGFGRVDMDAATNLPNTTLVDENTGVAQAATKSVNVQVGTNGLLLATLVYTDAPGTPNAAKALVNDLDLEVRDAAGQVVAAPHNRTDNHEFVELKNLPAGVYTVNVVGFSVPQGLNGAQPYSLVVTTDVAL